MLIARGSSDTLVGAYKHSRVGILKHMSESWGAVRDRAVAGVVWAALALGLLAGAGATPAFAAPANIHIHGTAPENVVNIRPLPNTSQAAIGTIPEGASPDYNCYTYGEVIGNVPVWFSVNYNGVTGYYASYYDDSSYKSEDELTAKYGIQKCGATPPPVTQPTPAPTTPAPATPAPTTPAPTTPAPAASEATQTLPIDADIWCNGIGVHAFDTETRDGGVKLQYDGVTGTPRKNNWRCQWLWSRGGRTGFFPQHKLVNIDFKSACQQQFPGTTLHYNEKAATGWPWECLGVAGKYYPPPGLNLLGLVRSNGYNARALRARTAGARRPAGGLVSVRTLGSHGKAHAHHVRTRHA